MVNKHPDTSCNSANKHGSGAYSGEIRIPGHPRSEGSTGSVVASGNGGSAPPVSGGPEAEKNLTVKS